MSSDYCKQLDATSKQRYVDKLTYNGEVLPDPLDKMIRPYVFLKNMKIWPPVSFGDVYLYLVENECAYTKESFKNYKALDCYNYVLSGRVTNILSYCNNNLKLCILTCDVQGSQSVRTIHHPWVLTTTTGVVQSGHCTCMAGLGEVCSHVAALLLTVEVFTREGVNSPSPTSLSCLWNKPSKKVEAKKAVEIQFHHKRKAPARKHHPSKMPSRDAYNTFLKAIQEGEPHSAVLSAISDEDTDTASEGEMVYKNKNIENIPNLIDHYDQINVKLPPEMSTKERLSVLMENSQFASNITKEIEESTRNQSESTVWSYQRNGRLTASQFGRILRCVRGHTNLLETIMGKNFSNYATEWGIKKEKLAKKQFQLYLKDQHVNAQLLSTGFLIDKEFGFLGATPDGMVVCDCCETSLVEIKCPARGKDLNLKEIPQTNFFLDGELNLKFNTRYYDQIQGQMDIWNINRCFFVTYTDIDFHIQIIEYDCEYWNVQKQRLINFFKEFVIPEILKKISKNK